VGTTSFSGRRETGEKRSGEICRIAKSKPAATVKNARTGGGGGGGGGQETRTRPVPIARVRSGAAPRRYDPLAGRPGLAAA